MKTRVYRIHLAKALNHYNELLAQKFGAIAKSEAIKELIRLESKQIQTRIARAERTNAWQIPIVVEFFDNGTYTVKPENENQILIID
jgi:hypothetical protein